MRFHERMQNLKWKKGVKRPDKSNAIDLLCSNVVPISGIEREDFEKNFDEVPTPFTSEEREAWLAKKTDVAVSSDAFVRSLVPNTRHDQLLIKPCSFHLRIMFLLRHAPAVSPPCSENEMS